MPIDDRALLGSRAPVGEGAAQARGKNRCRLASRLREKRWGAGWQAEEAREAGTETGGAGPRAQRPTTEGCWVEGTWADYRDGFGSCIAYYRGRVTRVLSTRVVLARVLPTTGARLVYCLLLGGSDSCVVDSGGFGSCIAYYRVGVTRVLSTRVGSARVLPTAGWE